MDIYLPILILIRSLIQIPQQLFKPFPKLVKLRILFVAHDVPTVQLEGVTLADELVKVFSSCDGQLGLIGTAHTSQERCSEGG